MVLCARGLLQDRILRFLNRLHTAYDGNRFQIQQRIRPPFAARTDLLRVPERPTPCPLRTTLRVAGASREGVPTGRSVVGAQRNQRPRRAPPQHVRGKGDATFHHDELGELTRA